MKQNLPLICTLATLATLALISCSDDTEEVVRKENFFVNFRWADSLHAISTDNYELRTGNITRSCAVNYPEGEDEYIYGLQSFVLEDPSETNIIASVDFAITQKVFRDELDTSDELSYLKQMLHADQYGFPINQSGYFTVYDLENVVFTVDREVQGEAYFYFTTLNGEVYRSTSIVPNERSEGSYFFLDRVITTADTSITDYQYIIEGRFGVNLFRGSYGTESEMVEGTFRWPVGTIKNTEMLYLCNGG